MTKLIPGKLYTVCDIEISGLTAYGYNDSIPKTLFKDVFLDTQTIFVYLYTRCILRGSPGNRNHYFILFESKIYTICFYGDQSSRLEQYVCETLND